MVHEMVHIEVHHHAEVVLVVEDLIGMTLRGTVEVIHVLFHHHVGETDQILDQYQDQDHLQEHHRENEPDLHHVEGEEVQVTVLQAEVVHEADHQVDQDIAAEDEGWSFMSDCPRKIAKLSIMISDNSHLLTSSNHSALVSSRPLPLLTGETIHDLFKSHKDRNECNCSPIPRSLSYPLT